MVNIEKSAITSILLRSTGAVLAIALQVILARLLGTSEYGLYSFAISWIVIITLFSTMGFDTSLTRHLPEYINTGQYPYFHGIIKYSFTICLASSLIISAILFFIFQTISNPDSKFTLLYALPLITLITLTNIRQSSLRGLKKYTQAILPETVIKPLLIISIIAVYYIFNRNINATNTITIQVIASTVTLAIGTYYLRKTVRNISPSRQASYMPGYWIKSSLPMLAITSSAYIITQTDIIMLGILKDMHNTGIYTATSKLSEVVVFWMAAVNFVIAPMISEAYHSKNSSELQQVVSKSTKISFILALLSFMILLSFGSSILGFFGADFTGGYQALNIIMVGHVINAASGPVGILLSMTGQQKFAAKTIGICALLNIVLNYILIPHYGLTGAAFSTMISTASWNVIMLFKVRQNLHLNPSIIGSLAK